MCVVIQWVFLQWECCLFQSIRPPNTCRRNTIFLASCISFSSCSWWASSCSTQDFSSSCPSCPREGQNPQSSISSKIDTEKSGMQQRRIWFISENEICCVRPYSIRSYQPVTDFFSVGSDLSSRGSPRSSDWSLVSSLEPSVVWVITYSSLGEWAGLAEERLKQMVGTGSSESYLHVLPCEWR